MAAEQAEIPTFFVPETYFILKGHSKVKGNYLYTCQKCLPEGSKTISANSKSRVNLRNHIKSIHNRSLPAYDLVCKEHDGRISASRPTQEKQPADEDRQLVQFPLKHYLGGKKLTQHDLDDAVVCYITESVLPFNHVQSPAFKVS
jgi:hypothetical protein